MDRKAPGPCHQTGSGAYYVAAVLTVAASCFAGWLSQQSAQGGGGSAGEHAAAVSNARDALLRYAANPGSKIIARVSREALLAQISELSASRALEEHAKVLCVQGQGGAAERALRTQLALASEAESANVWARSGHWTPGDSSVALIQNRLAQVLFARGDFSSVVSLLTGILDTTGGPERLGEAPQWWGHLQLRLALLWSSEKPAGAVDISRALLSRLCAQLRVRVAAPSTMAIVGGNDSCAGPAAVRALAEPSLSLLADFGERGYILWPAPLPAESIQALRGHTSALLANVERETRENRGGGSGAAGYDARQHRHGWHNEPAAGFFHYALAEALRGVLGVKLVPTYVFTVVYMSGGILHPHLDRPDNEVSLTVSMGSDPPGYIWPLEMNGTEFLLQPGDAVLYRGNSVRHSRKALPQNYRSFHVIFAFREQCDSCCHLV
ncbi:unnamed protein product [Polarella glacialis]|uniref:Uncharacterized protein n=1 Tax=Polarella glacialis TaxID=89957 RepID=A0A813J937_POLGL|nr:unnamed protein product [Polarella glacialis]CAE8669194.1 unnamed protein product [Polarella glacialis]